MCGIAGILTMDLDFGGDEVVSRMLDCLYHRGPDEGGRRTFQIFVEGGWCASLFLGHRRLSIIDLENGRQPMGDLEGRVWVSYNGEIYNFPELREELIREGWRFRTRSDTEVLLYAYRQWGIEFLSKLNGIFAFFLFDLERNQGILARDPFGVKPLYYSLGGEDLVFSSEVKALFCHPRVSCTLSPEAIDQYLSYRFVPSPLTAFANIYKVKPGHALLVGLWEDRIGLEEVSYFQLSYPDLTGATYGELLDEYHRRFRAAVGRQMLSDVPVGLLLSGGVDSSLVLACMKEWSEEVICTYTAGFCGDYEENELAEAAKVAGYFGCRHRSVLIEARDYVRFFPRYLWHLEETISNPSSMAWYYVSERAAREVKVVLTGQGADEPWGGYRRYLGERLRRYLAVFAPLFEEFFRILPRMEFWKRGLKACRYFETVQRFLAIYEVFDRSMKRRLYLPSFASRLGRGRVLEPLREMVELARPREGVEAMMFVDTRMWLPDDLLTAGDKMSMAVSLEARVPLLDVELMAFVEALPLRWKFRFWSGKYLHKKLAERYLPLEVVHRPKKGFPTPIDLWFQKELKNEVYRLLVSKGSFCPQIFSRGYMEEILEDHIRRRVDYRRHIFLLLTLEMWAREFFY